MPLGAATLSRRRQRRGELLGAATIRRRLRGSAARRQAHSRFHRLRSFSSTSSFAWLLELASFIPYLLACFQLQPSTKSEAPLASLQQLTVQSITEVHVSQHLVRFHRFCSFSSTSSFAWLLELASFIPYLLACFQLQPSTKSEAPLASLQQLTVQSITEVHVSQHLV